MCFSVKCLVFNDPVRDNQGNAKTERVKECNLWKHDRFLQWANNRTKEVRGVWFVTLLRAG